MSEDKTAEMNGAASFEERVFARFDALDRQSANVQQQLTDVHQEIADVRERVKRLEAKQYDTKLIWEKALTELFEMRQEMRSLNRKITVLYKDMVEMRADQNDFDIWLERLESPQN